MSTNWKASSLEWDDPFLSTQIQGIIIWTQVMPEEYDLLFWGNYVEKGGIPLRHPSWNGYIRNIQPNHTSNTTKPIDIDQRYDIPYFRAYIPIEFPCRCSAASIPTISHLHPIYIPFTSHLHPIYIPFSKVKWRQKSPWNLQKRL